jgi:hypothetical protein
MKNTLALNLLAITMIIILSGCRTMEIITGPKIKSFPVEIISEPSGAKVEVNDDYIGETPLTINLEGWGNTRTFVRNHTIVAHPVSAGGQTQVKIFSGWAEPNLTYGDKIPKKIYFNMNLIRISK